MAELAENMYSSKLLHTIASIVVVLKLVNDLTGCALTQRAYTKIPNPQGDFVHPHASMVFKRQVDAFERVRILKFDSEGTNIGVMYKKIFDENEGRNQFMISIFVYPVSNPDRPIDNSLSDEVAKMKLSLASLHPGVVVKLEDTSLPQGAQVYRGKIISYKVQMEFATDSVFKMRKQLVHTDEYIFQSISWFIKFYVNIPEVYMVEARSETDKFIRSFHFP